MDFIFHLSYIFQLNEGILSWLYIGATANSTHHIKKCNLKTPDLQTYILSLRSGKGVYPQRDGSLAIVDIDASKGFIDLWVHFFVAIEGIHRNWYRQTCFFCFD